MVIDLLDKKDQELVNSVKGRKMSELDVKVKKRLNVLNNQFKDAIEKRKVSLTHKQRLQLTQLQLHRLTAAHATAAPQADCSSRNCSSTG